MPAAWAAWVIEAVEKWATLQGDEAVPDGWRCVGRAAAAREPGWLVLDTRDRPIDPDTLVEVCLAGEAGPDAGPLHLVDERRLTDDVVFLREPPDLPQHSRFVWIRETSRRILLEALREGLLATGPAPLAAALAAGALAGPPEDAIAVPPGLVGAQADAYRACHSSGLRMVWGAPGTGKTHVLARAVQDLVAAGRRVLLVSADNAAVDAALHAALPGLPDGPGTAVRVGPAHLADIARNADVQLDLLAGRASAEADRRRARIAGQLDELAAVDADIDDLVTRLVGYDDATYRAASGRIAAAEVAAGLELDLRTAEESLERTQAGAAQRLAQLDRTEAELAGLATARAALNAAAELAADEELADREVRRSGLAFATVDAVPSHDGGLFARRRRRKEAARTAAALRVAEERRDHVRARIDELRAAAAPVTPEDLAAADERWRQVSEAAAAARAEITLAASARDAVAGRIAALRAIGTPTDADRELVSRYEQDRLPESHERLRHLQVLQAGSAGLRTRLEAEHRELSERSGTQRAEAEARLVAGAAVVATTPARARVHPALVDASFEVVLVDEAGATPLAEVLLVLSRGSLTGVVFGDLRRPRGAVLGPDVERSDDAAVRRWVHASAFSHAGVRSPSDALRLDGCVALLHQFRFAPGLRRLVNDTGHEVLQDAGGLPGVTARPVAELVLVDVSTLTQLADVRQGGRGDRWRLAGALFSWVLAELHGGSGVGIVTPYRLQTEATLATLRDHGLAEVAVGTAAEVPGREFETGVLDVVDGGPGWAARGGATAADGALRLFAAGLTMATDRLYVLADARAARSATEGPLLHLRAALDRGDVRVWSGAALLGLAEPPAVVLDSGFTDAAQVVQRLVPVTDVQDTAACSAELASHVEGARHTIWMWAPWAVRRTGPIASLLAGAARRGVDVRVFLRPEEDRELGADPDDGGLAQLQAAGVTTVIRSGRDRRGAVVVDGRTVLLGTSHQPDGGTGREGMVTLTGPRFAERFVDELHGRVDARPRACPNCGSGMETARGSARGRERLRLCAPCRQAAGPDLPVSREMPGPPGVRADSTRA